MSSRHRPLARRLLLVGAAIAALLLAVAGCGGGSDSGSGSGATGDDSTGTAAASKQAVDVKQAPATTGEVEVGWQRPVGQENRLGYELLKASETKYLAKSLAAAFELPNELTIKG